MKTNCKRKKTNYDQSFDRFDYPSPVGLVFWDRFLMVYKPMNVRWAELAGSLNIFPCFAVSILEVETEAMVNRYFSNADQYQGLPWLRICCSQNFSQMEKVGAK